MIKFLFPTIMIILLLLLFYRDRKPCQRSRVTNEVHLVGRVSSSPFYSFWDRQNFFVQSCRCRRWQPKPKPVPTVGPIFGFVSWKTILRKTSKKFSNAHFISAKKTASYFGSVLVIDYFDVKEEREKKGQLVLKSFVPR